MSNSHDRLRFRRATLPTLPVIQDVKEPTSGSDVQDFCEALFGAVEDDNLEAYLQVRNSSSTFYDGPEKWQPTAYKETMRRPTTKRRGSVGSEISQLERKKNTTVETRRTKRKPTDRSGRQKEETTNVWSCSPEVIDLTKEEDVKKVALDFFSQEMKIDDETLEKTLERIYEGDDLDWECKCLEFSQVGNCKPAFAPIRSRPQHAALPDINVNKINDETDVAKKTRTQVKLPSIFQVLYSRPVQLKIAKEDVGSEHCNHRKKRHSIC